MFKIIISGRRTERKRAEKGDRGRASKGFGGSGKTAGRGAFPYGN